MTKFIDDLLGGSLDSGCGRCANCSGDFLPTTAEDEGLVQAAVEYYRTESWEEFSPRYFEPQRNGGKTKIDASRKPESGRVLCQSGDPGLGKLVSDQAETGNHFSDELVKAAVEHIEEVWQPTPAPAWVTAVPPESGRDEVTDIAQRIASKLGLPYESALETVESTAPQHEFANSYQKRWNVEDVFEATESLRDGPVLLIDDTVNSRWTLTEAGMTLRDEGSDNVYPFALAKRTNR